MPGRGLSTWWRQTRILLLIAFRNLFASRAKTLIVGGIILVGAFLVVVGSSIVDTIDSGMRRSVQESLAGHVQIYDARSKDELALYGGMLGEPNLEPFADFSKLKKAVLSVENVKAVVPMGIDQALLSTGNLFDVALEKLRNDLRRCGVREDRPGVTGSPCAAQPQVEPEYQAHKAHMKRMVELLRSELLQAVQAVSAGRDDTEREQTRGYLVKATSASFWAGFDAGPLDALEFLENRIAPLSFDGGFNAIRYVGTDVDAFQKAFEGTQIVEGGPIPHGQRGILLGKLYAEDWLKLRTARRLDKIKEQRDLHHKRIAKDEELQRWVKENQTSTRDILLQLDPIGAQKATERLQGALQTQETDLKKLIVELLSTDDRNFEERYRIFYSELAPLLQLRVIKVGDTMTIQAPSRSGYMNSVSVKVYGFVQWKGLEKSSLAGMMSVMDIMTFRDLYGFMTADKLAEIRKLKESAGTRAIARENAEAELFGGSAEVSGTGRATAIDEGRLLAQGGPKNRDQLFSRVYSQDEIDQGVAKNAAVILKDPSKTRETMKQIEAATRAAGLQVKTMTWEKASGMVGQMVTGFRYVLYGVVFIIFAVALVIINNAMVMATLQRVKEIGTMRALGAQRRFVLVMALVETVAVGLAFGAVGAGLGSGCIWAIRARGGIPAGSDWYSFIFSGPSLMPRLGTTSLVISLAIVLLVSMASAIYPAILATRVVPLEAMQSDD